MPVVLLERIPLPSLRTYTIVSFVLLACAVYYAHITVTDLDSALYQHGPLPIATIQEKTVVDDGGKTSSDHDVLNTKNESDVKSSESLGANKLDDVQTVNDGKSQETDDHAHETTLIELDPDEYVEGMVIVLIGEAWCVWHVKDKFWNFVFYKFIFVFGVLNVEDVGEMVPWCSWFAVLCLLHLLAELCKDRFEYLSFSPTTPLRTHIKVLGLLLLINSSCTGLLVLSAYIGYMFAGINVFGFMAAECILLIIKTQYVLTRYGIHLWDVHHEGVWENRAIYVYYSELAFELAALSIDFIHHLHMLLWGNILLSMASLVICMQMRYLFHEFQRRIRRYKNYRRVVNSMETKFPLATDEELENNDDDCAICWEKMDSARKLPCSHLFHNACLRSWLEQDTTCPTCRKSLSDLNQRATGAEQPPTPTRAPPAAGANAPAPNPTFNHFFHFDGSRYVSWLPSFSVEVSTPHTQLLGNTVGGNPARLTPAQTSLLDNMARQVQEVFPNVPLSVILDDLRVTRSVEMSIENIIEGRLQIPPNYMGRNPEGEDDSSDEQQTYQVASSSTVSHDLTPDPTSMELSPPVSTQSGAVLNFISDSNLPDLSSDDTDDNDRIPDDTPLMSGSRFSKSSSEREKMLTKRKEMLIEAAKRKYLSQAEGDTLTEDTTSSTSSGHVTRRDHEVDESPDASSRRELVYRAVQRRLNQI